MVFQFHVTLGICVVLIYHILCNLASLAILILYFMINNYVHCALATYTNVFKGGQGVDVKYSLQCPIHQVSDH